MATAKPIQTKRGDTEVQLVVNMNLTGSTVAASVQDDALVITSIPCVISDALTGKVTITTSSLTAGKYRLEVQVTTSDSKVFSFPDSGYATLIVNQDIVV